MSLDRIAMNRAAEDPPLGHAKRRGTPAGAGRRRLQGVTLVELVVAITIAGIAIAAVLGGLSALAARSAEAMIREQAVSIGMAYLDEIVTKSFTADPVEASRSIYNDVSDYNGIVDSGARDWGGNPAGLPSLSQFTVAVSVVPVALGAVTAGQAKEIDVTVTHPSGVRVQLTGYRTLYP